MEKQMVLDGLRKEQKEIPFSLLYDTEGSHTYEDITRLQEYYLYNAELELLKQNAVGIAEAICPGSLFVELGCGSARKTAALLNAIQDCHGRCKYVGIDVSKTALNEARRNLQELVQGMKPNHIELLNADFLKCLQQVRCCHPDQPMCIAWLGSSVGNVTKEDAAKFFKDVIKAVGPNCQLLIFMDMWKSPAILYSAYHDREGVTEHFIKHGMQNALSCIGYRPDKQSVESWRYAVEINKVLRRVEMYITFTHGLNLNEHHIQIRPGERILVEFSSKYNADDIKNIATKACCQVYRCWGDSSYYTCQFLVPGIHALMQCWKDTDRLFVGILDWNSKPIDLRHPYLFYYGHVCAFTKLKIMQEEEETGLDKMLSRGIDPNVLDPSQCHSHPLVPSTWPHKDVITNYVKTTRIMIKQQCAKDNVNTKIFSMAIEHERMHHETLTYMMAQYRKKSFEENNKCPQNGYAHGHDHDLYCDAFCHQVLGPNILIEAGDVVLGVNPWDSTTFTWDNEGPMFHTRVSDQFLVSAKPVSIKDFLSFIIHGGYKSKSLWEEEDFTFFSENGFSYPATWSLVGNDYYIHGADSTQHWREVADEAVYVSLSEAEAFCKWMGCRVMTEAEYQRVLDHDKQGKKVVGMKGGGWEWTSTEFQPFPGFEPMPEYVEYSAEFFDGKHYVLKGWSCATHASMHRDTFRNFYQRQYRYVFSKFRCCRSLL